MRVICFWAPHIDEKWRDRHIGLARETRALVERVGGSFRECAGDDGYWRALCEEWRLPGLIVLEQDMVPTEDQLARMWRCPHLWCAYPYSMETSYQPALGCTKFAAGLVRRLPRLLDEVGDLDDDPFVAPRHWVRLDTRMRRVLESHGVVGPHLHRPPVVHLNPRQRIA